MAPKFGTSGLRGKVAELSDAVCAGYARAFLDVTAHDGLLLIARDLRPSSLRIARAVAGAAETMGLTVRDCGEVPTPALAGSAMSRGAPSIMITGSHIPADRNGLKFYTASGEITKADEVAIAQAYAPWEVRPSDDLKTEGSARSDFIKRYVRHFPDRALTGCRVGVYQHSSVARDLIVDTLTAMGAEAVPLGLSDTFIPVDTEAVDSETRRMLTDWAGAGDLTAIVSTDGDGDRPLVADADGKVIAGDILGTITSSELGATAVITPVSSNTMIEASRRFETVIRTRIGSPHVIAAMEAEMPKPGTRVAGFEANGGFLLGFPVSGRRATLAPLMTRDSFLPILVPLVAAARRRSSLAALVSELPGRRVSADRLENIPTDASAAFLARLSGDALARGDFFGDPGGERTVDLTDGLRVTFNSGEILHLRPSGNAPEFRCYAEADDQDRADEMVQETLDRVRRTLG